MRRSATARVPWLTAYVGAGLVGQVFGHVWQPVGGGNSVADCGSVGLLAGVVLLASRDLHDGALVTALVLSGVAVRVGAIDIL